MTPADKKQKAIDENFKAFSSKLPALMKTHAGKFAVLRDRDIVGFFDTFRDAMVHGAKSYDDGLFSVQEVTQMTVDLGWFSHADLHNTV